MATDVPHKNLTLRQTEALERQQAWANLSPKDQLASLDARLGKDVGAIKQRAKIKARLEAKKQ